jgi:hypothetical protein
MGFVEVIWRHISLNPPPAKLLYPKADFFCTLWGEQENVMNLTRRVAASIDPLEHQGSAGAFHGCDKPVRNRLAVKHDTLRGNRNNGGLRAFSAELIDIFLKGVAV